MFSTLGQILAPKPRQTEQTDTGLAIRRHDPEHERRRKKKDQKNEGDIFGDDNATISVTALRAFLQHFLDTQKPQKEEKSIHAAGLEISQSTAKQKAQASKPISDQAARAMNAYQTTARASEPNVQASLMTDASAEDIGLDGEDIRTVHQLMDDLKTLSDRNVEYITIEVGENFLASILNAVKHAISPQSG